jgi:hypothetical protein
MASLIPPQAMALRSPPAHASQSRPWQACHQRGQRHFDVLVFGDEPAAIMTALVLLLGKLACLAMFRLLSRQIVQRSRAHLRR